MPSDGGIARVAIRSVIAARTALGWSQRTLAHRAGLSPSFVSRFERGVSQSVSLGALERMFDALGIRGELRADMPIVDGPRGQVDAVHAQACAYVGRRLIAHGWDVRYEVEIGQGRFRGWIDVLGYRTVDRALITNEVKTDLPDIGGLQRAISWYEREAWHAARRMGWRPTRHVVALLALDSADVEAKIRANRSLLAAAFPARAASLAAWLAEPGPLPSGRCLALIDPASQARRWLRPTRSDGRRAPNRYENYADAAGRTAAKAR